jgi:hypothetical protein
VPHRGKLGRVNVVCLHSSTVLAGRSETGEGAVWGGGGLEIGQLALSKGPARIGIRSHVQRAPIPSKGVLSLLLYIKIHVSLNILIHNVCAFDIKRKYCFCAG